MLQGLASPRQALDASPLVMARPASPRPVPLRCVKEVPQVHQVLTPQHGATANNAQLLMPPPRSPRPMTRPGYPAPFAIPQALHQVQTRPCAGADNASVEVLVEVVKRPVEQERPRDTEVPIEVVQRPLAQHRPMDLEGLQLQLQRVTALKEREQQIEQEWRQIRRLKEEQQSQAEAVAAAAAEVQAAVERAGAAAARVTRQWADDVHLPSPEMWHASTRSPRPNSKEKHSCELPESVAEVTESMARAMRTLLGELDVGIRRMEDKLRQQGLDQGQVASHADLQELFFAREAVLSQVTKCIGRHRQRGDTESSSSTAVPEESLLSSTDDLMVNNDRSCPTFDELLPLSRPSRGSSSADSLDTISTVAVHPRSSHQLALLGPFSEEACGAHIKLSEDGYTATRYEGCRDSVVIGSTPLKRQEGGFYFEVKIEEQLQGWIGGLAVGVTHTAPSQLRRVPDTAWRIPKCFVAGYADRLYSNGLERKVAWRPDTLKAGQVVGIRVADGSSDFIISVDGQQVVHMLGSENIASGLCTDAPLYPVVDVFNATVSVSLCRQARVSCMDQQLYFPR